MPITILDYVKSKVGEKESYSASDFHSNGVEILGGCERCNATIACYNAYPSKSGYWRCAECIDEAGFGTVEEFEKTVIGMPSCPACGEAENIRETRASADRREYYIFECDECGAKWTL